MNRREPVSERPAHLDAMVLEQLAEGMLSPAEAAEAGAHVAACARCAAELDAYRSLFTALEGLPRLAPSEKFADAVMARVQIRPQESLLAAWLRRLAPRRRRGWAMVGVIAAAPATPLVALVALLLTQPLLSPATLWEWTLLQARGTTQAGFAWVLDSTFRSPLTGWLDAIYSSLQTVPVGALGGALGFLGVAIPLSAWALVRLTRSPTGSVTYAN
jgi:hypothetical protein